MMELIRLESCSVVRDGRLLPVIRDISLTVRAGERLSITGPSGSGKTTLALVIAGLLRPTTGQVIRMPPMFRRRAPIRMIFQDPFANMNPRWKVCDWLKDNCLAPAALKHVVGLCTELELHHDLLQRHPLELSGGECQRFNLIGALLGNPTLLILDEAMSMVDEMTAKTMETVVNSRREHSNISIVVVEHSANVSADQLSINVG